MRFQSRRTALDPAQQQMFHRIEGNGSQMQSVLDRLPDFWMVSTHFSYTDQSAPSAAEKTFQRAILGFGGA